MTYIRSPRLPLNIERDVAHWSESAFNVQRWGCTGDGVVDDTAKFQACVTKAIAENKPVFVPVPRAYYRITSTITGDGPCVIYGLDRDNTIIQLETSADVLFDWSGDGLELYGLTLKGDGFTSGPAATTDQTERAVQVAGASSAAYVTHFVMDNCRVQNWGGFGIHATFVRDFQVTRCEFEELGYAGGMFFSCEDGEVRGNYVHAIEGTNANQYGFAFTRTADTNLSTYPRCKRITCHGNYINDIPKWEALDIHSAEQVVLSNNTIKDVLIGINVGDSGVAADTSPYGITIIGNSMQSGVTDGSARQGIIIHGSDNGAGTPRGLCSCSVIGNYIEGFGLSNSSGGNGEGAIYAYCTTNLTVTGNTMRRCSPAGVVLDFDNYGFSVAGNAVPDPWSGTNNYAYGVYIVNGYNNGVVQGNSFIAESLSAPSPGAVLEYGFFKSASHTNLDIVVGSNHVKGAAAGDYFMGNNSTAVSKVGSILQTFQGRTLNYSEVNNTNANVDRTYEWISVSTSTATVQLTLPSTHTAGDWYYIHDRGGNAAANNITIARNGNLINGAAADHTISTANDLVMISSNGSGWHTHTIPQ